MSVDILGPHFDIHGGGMDLKFPHHENEIAQTCAACDSPFVNVWMHNGFVRVDDEKMSKSLGNFFTVREVLEWVRDPEVVRYFIVNSQYRGPINYTPDSLAQADAALERLYTSLRGVPVRACGCRSAPSEQRHRAVRRRDGRRLQYADRGVGTAVAGARDQHGEGGGRSRQGGGAARRSCARSGARLGLLGLEPEVFLRKRAAEAGDARRARARRRRGCVGRSVPDRRRHRAPDRRARVAARKAKDFKESDRIRDLLASSGVLLEDQPGGRTLWRRG